MKDPIALAQNDNFRHILCFLVNSSGMRMRAIRMAMDVLNIEVYEAARWVNEVANRWREKDPDGHQVKPLPDSFQQRIKA